MFLVGRQMLFLIFMKLPVDQSKVIPVERLKQTHACVDAANRKQEQSMFLFLFLFFLLGLHMQHTEVPRVGVKLELLQPHQWCQDPSRVCNLHHSSWQYWILNPLSRARDRTRILVDTSWFCYTEPQWEL